MKLNRAIQPKIAKIENLDYQKPERHYLDNGIPCYLINSGSQDLIKIDFIFKAGPLYQTQNLSASLTNKMLTQGTTKYSAFEIAEQMDSHGAYLDTNINKDRATISIYCLNKHLTKLLPILKEIIYEPTFPEKEFQTLLNKSKQEYLIELEKVKFLAAIHFSKTIYGPNHPYGKVAELFDYEKIKLHDLESFFKDHYTTDRCTIIATGKLPENLTEILNTTFNTKTISQRKSDFVDTNFNYQPGKHKIVKKGSLQSAIRIGKPTFNRLDRDFPKFNLLNVILGGYFGSRLMSNIREEKGYTYGINSNIYSLQHSGYFSIVTEVGSNFSEAALHEIYKEIHKLQSQKVPEDELELVKNYITGQIIRSLDGPLALSEKIRVQIMNDLPDTYYKDFVQEINQTDADDLIFIANQHLDTESLTELVVGN